MRTYDIINAGAKNRFMAGGRIVSNSGRLVQVQNLPQNHLKDLELARDLLRSGRFDDIALFFENVPNLLSELIRTAFIPKPKHRFIVADFSAIEARVIAWLAGEQWRLDVFNSHGKIYEASASQMFKVPIEEVTKGSVLRQKGKVAELACIAENELVLTDKGRVPIQHVTNQHKLWDGENWVTHGGVIYKGEKNVISYGGLTATPDHKVWIEGQPEPVYFGFAAGIGAHLVQTGRGAAPQGNGAKISRVYDILLAGDNNRYTVSNVLVHNCGYGGGVGALTAMGAVEMGLKESELPKLIGDWRSANPAITKFWWDIDKAAMTAVKGKTTRTVGRIEISCKSGMMFITLPSGRRLAYVKPLIEVNKFGRDGITYEGIGTSKNWMRIDTYGAKLVENIVQATARDLLAEAMMALDAAGYEIVMHCHDEAILESPVEVGSIKDVCDIMGQVPEWADGLPHRADGYECLFYKKE